MFKLKTLIAELLAKTTGYLLTFPELEKNSVFIDFFRVLIIIGLLQSGKMLPKPVLVKNTEIGLI